MPSAGLALRPILPDAFPFAVRLNVELLGVVEVPPLTALYGSSCALSSCIPLARPVAGVSVGIVDFAGEDTCDLQEDPERFEFLADVSGLEEDLVELEVQLAGTERGVTALHAACQVTRIPRGALLPGEKAHGDEGDDAQEGDKGQQSQKGVMAERDTPGRKGGRDGERREGMTGEREAEGC